MKTIEICENNGQYLAFPNANEVFESDFERECMLPYGVLYIEIDQTKHEVLLATPIADEEGLIGKKNFGEHCGYEWLTYSNRNGKWSLDCTSEELRSFSEYRAEILKIYQKMKLQFDTKKYLPMESDQIKKCALFVMGGEVSSNENWYVGVKRYITNVLRDKPGKEDVSGKLVTLVGKEGHEYTFLGRLSCVAYVVPTEFLVFYNSHSKRVLVVSEFY